MLVLNFWLFGLAASSASAGDGTAFELSKTDSVYISYIHEICNLSKEFGDDIWPGLDYNDIPILIYRPDTIVFLFNHPDPPPEFEQVEGLPWDFQNSVYELQGKFRHYVGQFWIWEDINGLPAFVVPYGDKESWEQRFFLFVIHEAFHTFQTHNFADRGDSQEEYYPLTIPENNALATLENLILAKAAEALIERNRDEVKERARQVAVVRAYRFLTATPFVPRHERIKERLENTAYYVEKKFQEAGGSAGYHPTKFLEYARFDPYISRTEALASLKDGIEKHIKNGAIVPMAMPRYRIYDNGATVGYLLDFLNIDWKEQAMSDSAFLFHTPLIEHFNIAADRENLERSLIPIKQEFRFDEIAAAAESNINEYKAEVTALEKEIRNSGNNEFIITMNAERSFSRSKRGSKRVLYADEGHMTLMEGLDQCHMKTKTSSVSLLNTGLIFYMSENEKTRVTRIFTDQLPESITIDGGDIPFAEGDYPFQSSLLLEISELLEIHGESGKVVVHPGKVEIFLE